jgi:AmiR/NasT family two-component response regulator
MTAALSILIVEDERIVAKDLQQSLLEMGYDAFAIASSADDAMRCASERRPDVVLMDIRIKGERDGIEAADALRTSFGVPVVYLTAHADEATLERAKRTEPYGYLVKPVKSSELRSVVEVSVHKHAADRRLRERERWFSTTLRCIADAVVTVDVAGNVSFMNPVAEELTGMTSAEALGRPNTEVVRLRAPQGSALDAALATRGPVQIDEATLERAGLRGSLDRRQRRARARRRRTPRGHHGVPRHLRAAGGAAPPRVQRSTRLARHHGGRGGARGEQPALGDQGQLSVPAGGARAGARGWAGERASERGDAAHPPSVDLRTHRDSVRGLADRADRGGI